MLSNLVCMGRHTITGLLCTSGRQFRDWSADYRLYAVPRFKPEDIFATVLSSVRGLLKPEQPLVTALDDSLVPKCGKRTPGVSYRRDPLGPPFSVNFITAQRFLQLSAAVPHGTQSCGARMIPVDFTHAPSPKKPRRSASGECWDNYHRLKHAMSISRLATQRLHHFRNLLDRTDPERPLWVTVDGRFTNGVVLKNLPGKTTVIGRIRGDAKLYFLPDSESTGSGRKRRYGQRAPTPEEVRHNEAQPWMEVSAFACGKIHNFKVKTLSPLRWRRAGGNRDLRLIVVAPLGYRLRKGAKLMYRRPAYLVCTDPTIQVEKVLQAYIWRWDIEVNFRDEKQLLGVGHAQVRNSHSVQSAPAMAVASYAILLLAAEKGSRENSLDNAPLKPKWRSGKPKTRRSTGDLIRQLRGELLAQTINENHFSGFLTNHTQDRKPEKCPIDFKSALVYAAA